MIAQPKREPRHEEPDDVLRSLRRLNDRWVTDLVTSLRGSNWSDRDRCRVVMAVYLGWLSRRQARFVFDITDTTMIRWGNAIGLDLDDPSVIVPCKPWEIK